MEAQPLIAAVCSGRKLQEHINRTKASPDPDSFDIWWLGQSGFLIQWNGVCILFDPYLSDSLTRKYSGTSKPHERMSEQVILPEWLDQIDIVTSSHNHTDHLDAETLIPILAINPAIAFVIPEANRAFVCERIKCAIDFPIGLNAGEHITLKSFDIHGVPAAHNTIERNENGQCKFMGFVVTFGKWTIYHSGDTLWYDEMIPLLKPFNIDVAFLPINGNDPSRGVAGNLNANEAVQIAKQLNTRVIPHHYHMFKFNTVDPEEFVKLATGEKVRFDVLKLGEHLTVR